MTAKAFDEAFEKVKNLAATFKANEFRYLSAEYQEAEARKDFIDKFFIALGWDVNHDQQTNPYEQEVKVEPPVSAGGQRRADYAFHVAPNYRDVRFYVEAKKPHGDIATADNYFQTIRYGWNSDTPLAVLTDFEQFHVLDCRYKPDIDTALLCHVAKYHYSEYTDPKKFAEIYWLFSREAVADGSLEKRAKELPKPRGKAVQRGLFPGGYQRIDDSFLKELDEYRTSLARTFKNKNPKLDSETLTELAQRTLDRLVFLRFLEDKGIEPHRLVDRFGERGTAWDDFVAASRRLDGIYNGVVFKHHEILDGEKFRVDDTVFADICESLAHINSPYDFDAIPIHILGSIYERFLGKVIVATGKRATVVDKPEVRKAGGVYYTPEYIVRYIVENTVGKLIAGKTPDQIAEMRFGDIACGSGSFLLGVYDLLLTYHGKYYNENLDKTRKGDCLVREGKLFLSLRKKREILLNNIYGVDIDTQAVEVAQLSLYLKLLQDETTATAHQYFLEFEHTARLKKLLPDLSKNIVCGNSLIGTDILEGQLFPRDEEHKLNSMNFEDAFPEVMKRGGFDAIVGNPPYLGGREWKEEGGRKYDYFMKHFTVAEYQFDIYALFWERGIRVLKQGGRIGFITPNTWLNNQGNTKLRQFIMDKTQVATITDYSRIKVFSQAVVLPIITILERSDHPSGKVEIYLPDSGEILLSHRIPQDLWCDDEYKIFNIGLREQDVVIRKRVEHNSVKLESLADVKFGIKIYETGKGTPPQKPSDAKRHVFEAKQKLNSKYRRYLEGKDVNRYQITWKNRWLKYGENLAAHRDPSLFEGQRLLVRRIVGERLISTFTDEDFVTSQLLQIVKPRDQSIAKYLLGILNSSLLAYHFKKKYNRQDKTFPEIRIYELSSLPIRSLELANPANKSCHDKIVQMVDAMLEAKKQLAKAKSDKNKTYFENKCAALDRQIDRLVYDLYGLSEEDIRIVEGGK